MHGGSLLDDEIGLPYATGRVPLHAGNPLQPQNAVPELPPRLATRCTMTLAQIGHDGVVTVLGDTVSAGGGRVARAADV